MKKKKKNHLPFRLNTLFFVVFVLFSVLIVRLGVVQLVYGEEYANEVASTEESTTEASVPRGLILDRNLNTIVDNTPQRAITFTRESGASYEELLEVATKLSDYITVSTKKITDRDLKDYWIVTREEEAEKVLEDVVANLSSEDKVLYEEGEIGDSELYQLQIESITDEQIATITKKEKQILAIKVAMSAGYANTAVTIKKNATQEEYAKVSENLEHLEGVDVGTDWERDYKYGSMLRTLLGNITDSNEGLPSEKLDYYLSQDYARNDRVGKSYIELQYESLLRGQKEVVRNITDKSGNVVDQEVVQEGQRGKDLVLTIDMELQEAVEKILLEELANTRATTSNADRAFVVMMDPKTGEVLSMAGKQYVKQDDGTYEIQDYALGTFTSAYEVGSVVKGATIATALQTGTISPGEYLVDEPIKISGTEKKSWRTFGSINDITALKVSSNVYMFKIAMRIMNASYSYGNALGVQNEDVLSAYSTIRYYYAQFGLGVLTGIDLPNEFAGITGTTDSPGVAGKLLDLAIGQYDTYTALQLAQYVSTIANGGYRLQPQVLKEVRTTVDGDTGESSQVLQAVSPKVLNKVDVDEKYLKRIQEGFRQVMSAGGTASAFAGKSYKPAGKTGTAETFINGNATYNITLIGYAPYDDPEIAFSVIVPYAGGAYSANNYIGERILDKYFELKEKRESNSSSSDDTEESSNSEE